MIEEVKIASVHFAPLKAERGRPLRKYHIPAAEGPGKVQILVVRQTLEHDEGPYNGNKGREKITRLIDAMDIGRDLIREWTQSGIYMGPDASGLEARPGAWLVRDRVPVTKKIRHDDGSTTEVQELDIVNQLVFRPATADEYKQMWEEDLKEAIECDARYGEKLIREGIARYSNAKQNPQDTVSNPMRLAARFYNVQPVYMQDLTQTNTKKCQYCQSTINAAAVICPQCSQVVDQYQKLMIERAEKEEAAKRAAERKAS